jgi:DNA-binding PadR family transcriptional regulator
LLQSAPLSGYDIRRETSAGLGHFWSESYGQIYPALRSLAARGHVRRRSEKRTGRRARIVYSITPKGRETLRRWTLVAPRVAPARNELLLKLYFGRQDSASAHAAWLRRLANEETERLNRLRRLRQQLVLGQIDRPNPRLWMITLEHEERLAEARVAWCRKTLGLYAMLVDSRGKSPSPEGEEE